MDANCECVLYFHNQQTQVRDVGVTEKIKLICVLKPTLH